jgi:hypothetical protein
MSTNINVYKHLYNVPYRYIIAKPFPNPNTTYYIHNGETRPQPTPQTLLFKPLHNPSMSDIVTTSQLINKNTSNYFLQIPGTRNNNLTSPWTGIVKCFIGSLQPPQTSISTTHFYPPQLLKSFITNCTHPKSIYPSKTPHLLNPHLPLYTYSLPIHTCHLAHPPQSLITTHIHHVSCTISLLLCGDIESNPGLVNGILRHHPPTSCQKQLN